MKREHIQYSKILPFITGIVFAVCLFFAFTADVSSLMDTSIYATAITISGGIWGSTIVWYSKKAQSENLSKLKIELYKQSTNERLRFNKEMMELKKQYEMTDEDVEEIELKSNMSVVSEQDLNDALNVINNGFEDSDSKNEIESF